MFGAVSLLHALLGGVPGYADNPRRHDMWRTGAPIAAILIPAALFLSVASPDAKAPNGLLALAYAGAIFLGGGTLSLGIGLIRAARSSSP